MKITCHCGQEMNLAQTKEKDEYGRTILHHSKDNIEEIEIYEFKKSEENVKHSIGFYCNACEKLFIYNIEHRD